MPHVAKFSDDLGPMGLVVIGAHVQQGTPDEIRSTARSRGAGFTILKGASVKDGGDFDGIPHTMLFDHTGKCVYRGHPTQIDKVLKETVGKALAAKFEGEPTKAVAPLLENLKKGQSPAGVLQKAISASKSTDKPTADQAKQLVEKMTETAGAVLSEAEALKADDPLAALSKLTKLSTDFKGTPTGTKAGELVAELKKDKAVQAELKARPTLEKIKTVDTALTAALNGKEPNEAFQTQQAGVLKQLKSAIAGMKKSYPDAKSTQEAVAIGEKYGIKLN